MSGWSRRNYQVIWVLSNTSWLLQWGSLSGPVGVGVEPQPLGQVLCLPLGQSGPETQAIPGTQTLAFVGGRARLGRPN